MSKTTCEKVWKNCLKIIQDNVAPLHFKTWFSPIQVVKLEEKNLVVEVPTEFFYEYLEENYVDLLTKVIKRELGDKATLEYKVRIDPKSDAGANTSQGLNYQFYSNQDIKEPFVTKSNVENYYAIPGLKKMQIHSQLKPEFNFQSLIEGDFNRVPIRAGKAIAANPGKNSFNPILIYGSVGLGKTHIIQAIGNETKSIHPDKVVLFVSAEKFINQFQEHSRKNIISDFIRFYQQIDILIIDDIHFFKNANKSQDALFAIFNHLHQNEKQFILTSDCSPNEIEGVADRLISRFKWGVVTELTLPDEETRYNIVSKIAKYECPKLTEDIIQYVAANVRSNIRDIKGVIISIAAHVSLNNAEPTLEVAKKCLKNIVNTTTKEATIDSIQTIVCDYFNMPFEKVFEKNRKREIVQARQISMYFSKKYTKNSLSFIGDHFGGLDHSTVIHAIETVKNLMDTDDAYRSSLEEIQQKIQISSL